MWDVLSNKEAVDIIASAPGRGTAARALVDCATRAWRLKYPTSKNDDCAVVCLFLEHAAPINESKSSRNDAASVHEEENEARVEETTKATSEPESGPDSRDLESIPATKQSSEIVPVVEEIEEKRIGRSVGQSKRSLAECLSTADDEEWSALEGITRVNSLLSLPRFLPFDRRSTSWRKWL